ncbi:hypothetical protein BKA69DRAFT_594906 [Paraphysoderma sedebokerense]|nr:hypothetical protein BKA69DRAFT_594906 [Paraphysoderma sedebokerense]
MFQLEKIMRHASVFVASFCILLQLVVGANIYEFNITTGEFKPFNASLIPPNTLSWFDKKVLYVGDGGKDIPVVDMWSPLPTGEIVTTLTAMSDFVDATRDTNNAETVRMKLTHKGWSDVVTEPVCKNDTQACPQIIVVGTTQVVTRTYDGTAESFEEYFADWQQEKGYSFTDDIIKYAFYDYFVNGSWHGIPLYSDFRTLYFNKTTFDRLGLDYPPPLGNTWGAPYWKNWTWEKMVEVATYISQNYDNTSSTVTPGVRLSGLVGMEMQILPSLYVNCTSSMVTHKEMPWFNF